MKRNTIWKLALVLALFPAAAHAQLPSATGTGPMFTTSLGYSYMSVPIPSATRIDMNGVSASATVDFRSRFGAKVDVNYVRQANVFGTGHHGDVLTYMVGPMFYPVSNDRWVVYVQALAGGTRSTGVVPNSTGGFDTAFADALGFAVGAGIERSLFSTFAIRTEADYMYTSFADATAALKGQSDLRFTGSLVYRFHWHWNIRRSHGHWPFG
jgi:hypothetical protein